MRYGSVCSGIEAATSAWHSLGWTPQWFSEIEPFPSAVLAHHYPNVPNFGDMTKFKEWKLDDSTAIDVLVGGTPCQSFSVAGLRKGLDDPRGNLMLTYLAIARKYRPKWLVWENVPGVLSSSGGEDFASLLRGMGECGYGFAYRVLDAQYFGVAQRRRRVFVVGCLGDWRAAAAVLFERHSLSGHPAPSRKARQSPPGFFESSLAQYRQADVGGTLKASGGVLSGGSETFIKTQWPAELAPTLNARYGEKMGLENQHIDGGAGMFTLQPIPIHDQATRHAGKHGDKQDGKGNGLGIGQPGDPMNTLTKGDRHAVAQPIPLDLRNAGRDPEKHDEINRQGVGVGESGDPAHTLTSACVHGVAQPIAFNFAPGAGQFKDDIYITTTNISRTIDTSGSNPAMHQGGTGVVQPVAYAFDALSSNSMKSSNPNSGVNQVDVSKTLDTSRGLDPSCNQGGIGVIVAIPISTQNALGRVNGRDDWPLGIFNDGDPAPTPSKSHGHAVATNVGVVHGTQDPCVSDIAFAQGRNNGGENVLFSPMAVRRLTPVECERLQGFPNNHTNIPWRKKPESPDGPRYKALGNSMAVPVMNWIGKRIQMVEDL